MHAGNSRADIAILQPEDDDADDSVFADILAAFCIDFSARIRHLFDAICELYFPPTTVQ